MSSTPEKKTAPIRAWVEPDLELRLRRMAEADDRPLSEYVTLILRRHVYGNDKSLWPTSEGPERPE